uniref:Taste receptor type 2 n=1 Tax=Catagonus wagneri TaxID=51154 RepID=A0A8C3WEZ3_9CETA
MFPVLRTIFLILSVMEFFVGMLGNVFIGLVNCSEWIKNQKISLVDFILTSLAISNVSQLFVILLGSLIITLFPGLLLTIKLAKPSTLIWRTTSHFTTWLAACLSIFYLLKIAHFSHCLFLWLKQRVNRVIPMILAFSLVFLVFDFLLLETFNDIFQNTASESNLTLVKRLYFKSQILLSLTFFFPVVLSLISLFFLFLSLVKHTRNLKLNFVCSRDFSTEAHERAMKMVTSVFLLIMVHFFSIQLTNWMFLVYPDNEFTKFFILPVYIFPSGHSFILILGSNKLRQRALKVLRHLKPLKRENPLALQIHLQESFQR